MQGGPRAGPRDRPLGRRSDTDRAQRSGRVLLGPWNRAHLNKEERALIWNPAMECMAPEARGKLQVERLRALLRRVNERVPFYRKRLSEAGVNPEDVRSLEDLKRVPFTVKTDLRDHYPFGLFAAPMQEIVRIHASSGTTGKPTVVGYTRSDIDVWSEVMARSLVSAGTRENDIIQNAYGYGLFTGGLGAHYGAEKVGATVVPISVGNTKRQIMLMKDFGTTVLCATPSYALYLAEAAREEGILIRDLPLRVGVFGAEPWTDRMRQEIEKNLAIRAVDIYGLSEIIGPGVAAECEVQDGLHLMDDHFLPEVIDPVSGETLEDGEIGELVITTLTKEGIPLLRYRTRDVTRLKRTPCPCGRTSVRMHRLTGRSDDMLIIRGVNVFPSQIEGVLLQVPEVAPHYIIYVDRVKNLDLLEVHIEVSEEMFSDEVRHLEKIEKRIKGEIESVLGIVVDVKLVEPRSIARSEGKARRVIDRRKL
jgi:phenylacetate-CoA ligase